MRRWLHVALVAAFINTSYGTLSYSFSVLVTERGAGGEFGPGAVSLGFGLALLVSGVAGIAAGTVADVLGTRRLMAAGSVAGAAGLALLAACREPWQAVLVMLVVIGPATAATFYEPVYVLMNRWFTAPERPRAYGVLTMLSGVSITIFIPLTNFLVGRLGWEQAVLVLAGTLLVVGLAVPALVPELVERRPDVRLRSPGAFLAEAREGIRQATPAFWAFSAAFFLATAAFSGYSFHIVAQLETRGFDGGDVARAVGIAGIVSLPARFLLPTLSARASSGALLTGCLVLLGLAAWIATVAERWWQVWLYVGVFGLVFGAVYPLRALVTAERFAGPYFGRLIGTQALFIAGGRALGPIAIAAIGTDRDSYRLGFQLAGLALILGAFATWAAMRGRPSAVAAGAATPGVS